MKHETCNSKHGGFKIQDSRCMFHVLCFMLYDFDLFDPYMQIFQDIPVRDERFIR